MQHSTSNDIISQQDIDGSPTTNTSNTCPSCKLTNATFSKHQRKKPYNDRKCKQCVERMLLSAASSSHSSTQKMEATATEVKVNENIQNGAPLPSQLEMNGAPPSLSSSKKRKRKSKKKKKDKSSDTTDNIAGGSANKQLNSNNEDYNECKAVMSNYFQESNDVQQQQNNDEELKLMATVQNKHTRFGSSDDDDNDNNNSNDDDKEVLMGGEEVAKGGGCWSPMQSSEDENDEQEFAVGKTSSTTTKARNGTNNNKKVNSGSNNKKNGRTVRDKMELARKAAFGKRDEDDSSSRSSSDDEDDIYEDTKRPRIKSSNNNSNSSKNNEESLEALKQQILGRSITSMYDIDPTAEAALSSSSNHQQQRHINNTTDASTVANTLRQELSCPICHDRLYNPTSLLCGHSFCMSCLHWWLDRQQQQQQRQSGRGNADNSMMMDNESNDEEEIEWHGTCPTCRTLIPSPSLSLSSSTGLSCKPNIQVNTALKSVLETLYGNEMNQRRQAEHRQLLRARSGENDGLHARGYEEIVPLVDDEKDELSFIKDLLLLKDEKEDCSSSNGKKKRRSKYEDEENGWVTLHSSSNRPGWKDGGYSHGSSSSSIMIRRNIVLDDTDQRYQLSMGLTKCSYSNAANTNARATSAKSDGYDDENNNKGGGIQYGVLDIELCLLTMEEDEVDDSGFPTFINEGDDDEALICTTDDRVHSCIEAVARVVSLSDIKDAAANNNDNEEEEEANPFKSTAGGDIASPKVRELSLSRGMIGRDGAVRFRIDLSKALQDGSSSGDDDDDNGNELQIVKLKFRHVDTGAVLELRLPSSKIGAAADGNESDGETEFCGTSKPKAAKDDGSRYLLNDEDSNEEDSNEPNVYEEDGFVVHGEVDSSEEEEEEHHSSDDDEGEGECQVCKKGGDLIVCDGGDDRESGCGNMYHILCINREVIPPGDWICQTCANGVGLANVGIEGHEYKEEEDEAATANNGKTKEEEVDEEGDEAATANNGKTKQLLIDSDDDDEEDDDEIAPLQKKKKNKRLKRTILDDGDESDSD